jgi:FMN-dependent NADH-azoreductase
MIEHLLHVSASPRGDRSLSRRIDEGFMRTRCAARETRVDRLDPWTTDLPEVDGPLLAAKYAGLNGEALTPAQRAAWDRIAAIAERFRQADLLVFNVPLWNFGIPYRLKHLIDAVTHKDVLFTFDGTQLAGLLGGRTAVAIYTRGLDYSPDSSTPAAIFDHQKPYLDAWFRLVGITTVHSIMVENTVRRDDSIRDAATINEAEKLAATLPSRARPTDGRPERRT